MEAVASREPTLLLHLSPYKANPFSRPLIRRSKLLASWMTWYFKRSYIAGFIMVMMLMRYILAMQHLSVAEGKNSFTKMPPLVSCTIEEPFMMVKCLYLDLIDFRKCPNTSMALAMVSAWKQEGFQRRGHMTGFKIRLWAPSVDVQKKSLMNGSKFEEREKHQTQADRRQTSQLL